MEAIYYFELPAHVHANPDIGSMRQDAEDIVFMANDIFSARNEMTDGNSNNIIHVLAQQGQCSWRRASELTHEIIDKKVESFQQLEKQFYDGSCYASLAPLEQENSRRFIDGMKFWMQGSHEWHRKCPRYK